MSHHPTHALPAVRQSTGRKLLELTFAGPLLVLGWAMRAGIRSYASLAELPDEEPERSPALDEATAEVLG